MSELQTIASIALILSAVMLMFTGSLGILRLPDFYCRTHASSKVDTLGIIVMLAGIAVYEGLTLTSVKLAIAICFIALTNPIAVHALARIAMRLGLKPWLSKADESSPKEGLQ